MIEPKEVKTSSRVILVNALKHIFNNPLVFSFYAVLLGATNAFISWLPSRASSALEYIISLFLTLVMVEVVITTSTRQYKLTDIVTIPFAATKGTIVVLRTFFMYAAIIILMRVVLHGQPHGVFVDHLKMANMPFTYVDYGIVFVTFVKVWFIDLYVSARIGMFKVDTETIAVNAYLLNRDRVFKFTSLALIAVIVSRIIPYSGFVFFTVSTVFFTLFSMEVMGVQPRKKSEEEAHLTKQVPQAT